MKYIVTALLVLMSSFRVEMVYTGQPEWLLWGNPNNIIYEPENHTWINWNNLGESWRWADVGDDELRDKMLEPEKVPEKRKAKVSINLFWQQDEKLVNLPLALFYSTTKPTKRPRFVEDAIGSIDESKSLGRLVRYRARETFCPVTRALARNDAANIYGEAGAATDDLILSMELERLEKNRCIRLHRLKG